MTRPCPGADYGYRLPKIKPPPGSCFTQAYVFGPSVKFPYAAERGYTPPDCPVEEYLKLLGLDRGVIIHGSAHGSDNSVSIAGVASSPDRLRGIAVIQPDVSDRELEDLNAGGMRGFRLSPMLAGAISTDHLEPMAEKVAQYGWHVVLHVNDVGELVDLTPRLKALKIGFVVDHLGRVRGGQGIDHLGFQALLSLLRETDHGWAKLASWYRLSDSGPPYDDLTPLARALIEARRDRIVWGTNWPHPILRVTRCRTTAICSISSWHGVAMRRPASRFWSITRRLFMDSSKYYGG
jgi:2-pyrone-4,6-dicarboxylate lactonase